MVDKFDIWDKDKLTEEELIAIVRNWKGDEEDDPHKIIQRILLHLIIEVYKLKDKEKNG